MTINDPACGTGGFLLAAHEYISTTTSSTPTRRAPPLRCFTGWEIVDNTARLCAMNLLLHGIGSPRRASPITVDDALRADPGDRGSTWCSPTRRSGRSRRCRSSTPRARPAAET
jgi:type I restriction enzyme M protein